VSILKTAGGSICSESEGAEGRVSDFFDHWMEEYISKVAADQPGIGQQTPEHTDKTDGKQTAETARNNARNKGWER
jgi:hypothetical protein